MATRARPGGRPRGVDFTTPLTVPGGALAGAEVVRELGPELTLPVWQALRSVLLWAGEEPALRGDLFEPCAMADWERELLLADWEPDVRCPLAVIVGELSRAAQASAETVAHACLCVTEWCLARGHVATALAYAEAAALSWPQQPRYAWLVGRLLRSLGRAPEAEQWLKRAATLAGRAGDGDTQSLALNSLGNALYRQGSYPRAGRVLRDALRVARKHRLRDREGEILHDLAVLSMWSGELEAADQLVRDAYEIYRSGHPRIAALVYDTTVLWMMRGLFGRALFVLRELPPFMQVPYERARAYSMLARAAAACGDEPLFHEAWAQAMDLYRDPDLRRRGAPDFVELGLGASSLGLWELAADTLREGLELAIQSGETDAQTRAEAALAVVSESRVAENERNPIDADARVAPDALGPRFIRSLHAVGQPAAAA